MSTAWTVDGVPGYRDTENVVIRMGESPTDVPVLELQTRQTVDLGLLGIQHFPSDTLRIGMVQAMADPETAALAAAINTNIRALADIMWAREKARLLAAQAPPAPQV